MRGINHHAGKFTQKFELESRRKALANRRRVREEQRVEARAYEKRHSQGRLLKPTKNNNTPQWLAPASSDKKRLRQEADVAYEEWKTRTHGQAKQR